MERARAVINKVVPLGEVAGKERNECRGVGLARVQGINADGWMRHGGGYERCVGARWALWLRARAGTPIHAHTRAAMAAFEKAAQL